MRNEVSEDQQTDISSASGEIKLKLDDAAGAAAKAMQQAQSGNSIVKTIPHAQPTAVVGNNVLPENDSPNEDGNSRTSPSKNDNINAESGGSSKSDAVSAAKPETPQHSLPIATVAGEPIVAVPQRPSSQEGSESGPGAKSGEDPNSPNGNNDNNDNEQGTNRADPSKEPANFDPNYDSTAATNALTNPNPAVAPAALTTTINRHVIKGLPSSNLILIDGHTVTRGQGPITISSTPIALQNNGDLVIGTTSVKNLLSTTMPSSLQNPTANINAPLSPQIYRVGTARITADGPPITYAGTKIQALADGAVVVGNRTYAVTPTPMPTPTAAGTPSAAAGYSVVSEVASYNTNSLGSSGVGSESHKSASLRGATNVVAYHGDGGNKGVCWTLLLCAIIIGVVI